MPQGNFLLTKQKHYQVLGSARHQYGISVLVTQASFWEGSNGDLAKRQLFSQANQNYALPSVVPDQRNSSEKKITMLGFVWQKTVGFCSIFSSYTTNLIFCCTQFECFEQLVQRCLGALNLSAELTLSNQFLTAGLTLDPLNAALSQIYFGI